LRASFLAGQVFLFTGELERAHAIFTELRAQLLAHGLESDLPATAWLTVLTECLRGDLEAARTVAEEAVEGARELESRTTRVIALSARALAAAYRGQVEQARRDGEDALALVHAIGWGFGALIPLAALAFLAFSSGDPAETHRLLGPLSEQLLAVGLGEPLFVWFLPDEIEALLGLGELDQAERLIEQLEARGRALDRPWALATGARCRALLLAARGDPAAGLEALEQALVQHERLGMPFESARTLLVLGQLQRRLRRKRQAKESLELAKEGFERLGAALWAGKADAEIRRLGLRRAASTRSSSGLTIAEERVAALAASGLTNREIAAQLFLSPKTVQAHLGKVYDKRGIHSRAQLRRELSLGSHTPLEPLRPDVSAPVG
jgi:DNA-binding CsgD family transcriptional regulator